MSTEKQTSVKAWESFCEQLKQAGERAGTRIDAG